MVKPLVVLQSSPRPRATTNPYNVMLGRLLEQDAEVELRYFAWRTAIFGRYDVFHAHWPEILVDGHSPAKKLARQGLALIFFTLLRVRRVAVVRTVHNVELPSGISGREVALLHLFDRATTLRITLNPTTPVPDGRPSVVIPHGHYRDWFAPFAPSAPVPGRLAYVGNVRRYKSLDVLFEAFAETHEAGSGLTLTVAGNPTSEDQAQLVRDAAALDQRICVTLRFLTDEELVASVTLSEVVVLPYRHMHNSGGALAALSLDRVVLVPDNEVNALLAEEVGGQWVQRFTPPLRGADLLAALRVARGVEPGVRPDLSGRDWAGGIRAHVAAYRLAYRLRRGDGHDD